MGDHGGPGCGGLEGGGGTGGGLLLLLTAVARGCEGEVVVCGRVPLLRPPDGEHELLDTGLHRHKEADSAGVGPHGGEGEGAC